MITKKLGVGQSFVRWLYNNVLLQSVYIVYIVYIIYIMYNVLWLQPLVSYNCLH